MLNLRLARPMLIALAACAANIFVQGSALADDAQENKALREQMRQMMQRMDALQKQVEALSKQQAATPPPAVVTVPQPAPPPPVPAAPAVKFEHKEPLLHHIPPHSLAPFALSFDDSTKCSN